MIKKIMVTTDFSKCGNGAISYAFELARKLKATVILLYVVEREHHESKSFIDMTPLDSDEICNKASRKALKEMDKIIPEKLAEKVEFKKDVVVGRLAQDGIIDAVEKDNPDLLIMSSHGKSGFAKFLLGSTTDRVMRSVDCPVLLMKNKCKTGE